MLLRRYSRRTINTRQDAVVYTAAATLVRNHKVFVGKIASRARQQATHGAGYNLATLGLAGQYLGAGCDIHTSPNRVRTFHLRSLSQLHRFRYRYTSTSALFNATPQGRRQPESRACNPSFLTRTHQQYNDFVASKNKTAMRKTTYFSRLIFLSENFDLRIAIVTETPATRTKTGGNVYRRWRDHSRPPYPTCGSLSFV